MADTNEQNYTTHFHSEVIKNRLDLIHILNLMPYARDITIQQYYYTNIHH